MFHRLQLLGFSLNFGLQWLQGRCLASWPVTSWLLSVLLQSVLSGYVQVIKNSSLVIRTYLSILRNWYWDPLQQVKRPRLWLGIELQVSWFELRHNDLYTTLTWMFHRLQLLGFSLSFGLQWLQGQCSASWPVTSWLLSVLLQSVFTEDISDSKVNIYMLKILRQRIVGQSEMEMFAK